MFKLAISGLASLVAVSAFAQDSTTRLAKEELLSFLPGTKVTHTAPSGSVRRWTNEADGKFVASSTNKLLGSLTGTQNATGRGSWKIDDAGKYCVEIDWRRLQENWCSFVLKSADGAYYLGVADEGHRIEFGK